MKSLPSRVKADPAAFLQFAIQGGVAKVDSQQRAGQPCRHPGAVQDNWLFVGQPEPFQIYEGVVGVAAEHVRCLDVSALLQITDDAALDEALFFH